MISPFDYKVSAIADAIALNSLTLLSILTMAISKEAVTWVIGCIVGLTVAWFNVERALKTRRERMAIKDQEDQQED